MSTRAVRQGASALADCATCANAAQLALLPKTHIQLPEQPVLANVPVTAQFNRKTASLEIVADHDIPDVFQITVAIRPVTPSRR